VDVNCKELSGSSWEAFMSATPFEDGLASLRAHYLERIDAAVAAGRMNLVRELADSYEDEALQLMLAVEDDGTTQLRHSTAEILELGPQKPHHSRSGTPWFGFWRHRKR
jgi:hypothetical protein